jgi:glycosyltransferase involved in cell wall biosynthesis
MKARKIALIENFGSDFYFGRLRYAHFLVSKGLDVTAIVPDDGYVDKIKSAGINVLPVVQNVRGRSLSNILKYTIELYRCLKSQDFEIVHFHRMQPNLVGTFLSRIIGKKKIINHVTGLGYAFTHTSFKYKILQRIIRSIYRLNSSTFNAKIIFQNSQDRIDLGIYKRSKIIPGSAVNEDQFNEKVHNIIDILALKNSLGLNDNPTILFVSRLLKQKGLGELVSGFSKLCKEAKTDYNLVIAGWIDENNPDSFSIEEVNKFRKIENVFFLGKRTDVNQLIFMSDICVLPSYYREGTPRFLLEALSTGKPIITTNMPGCNHLIKGNRNGIIVKPKNSSELFLAMQDILRKDYKSMGMESKKIYDENFSEKIIYNAIYNMY